MSRPFVRTRLGVVCVLFAAAGAAGCRGAAEEPQDGALLPAPSDLEIARHGCTDYSARRGAQRLVILHTNDLHSHLNGHGPERDFTPAVRNDEGTIGGFARLAALVARERHRARTGGAATLLLDAGDFTMGTLFEFLVTSKATELKLMQAIGYDATTLGNHEFDYTPRGLAGILAAAAGQQVNLPILASNMVLDPNSPADDDLARFLDPGPVKRKLVKKVGGLKVGMFGLMGKDAVAVTPTMKPVSFEDIAVAAARMVTELRETDKVDLVIALSHSGINGAGQGEDADLARAVPGIDVIVSGHTHDKLPAPARVGQTLIVTAGAYGSHLGRLELEVSRRRGQISAEPCSYRLLPIDDRVAADPGVQGQVDGFISNIDGLLAPAGLAYRKVLAETAVDLPRGGLTEWPVGNLVVDSYRAVISALQPSEPPAVAVDANGQIRTAILAGKTGELWFADAFRVLPLGIGPDAQPGYPLVTFFITPKELKAGLELSAAADVVGGDFFLQVSGLKTDFDRARPPFGRVTSIRLVRPDGTEQPLDLGDTSSCVKVSTTFLVGGLLGLVESLTGGALSVRPKAADCQTPITDLATRIVDRDPATAGVQELKHWQAMVGYLGRLPDSDGDGVPNVPAPYGAAQGRITIH